EMRADKRMSHRWQLLGSYTLAFVKNTAEGLPADQFNPDAEYGWADPDRRHRLTVSGIIQLLGDVQARGIVRYQGSLPVNITAGRDLFGNGLTNARPPGITRNTGCRDLDLNAVNAYRITNSRAAVTGFTCADYLSIDLQASKRFQFGPQRSVEAIF